MKTSTLNKIRSCDPCADGWAKLLKYLGKTAADDEPLSFITILESNGLDDALWCCRSAPEYNREWRLYAVWCARQVQHLMLDPRSIAAIDVAERYSNGVATDAELAAARIAARATEWAEVGAAHAALTAVLAAAWKEGASGAASEVARAVRAAERAAEWSARATGETRAAQIIKFREIISGETI